MAARGRMARWADRVRSELSARTDRQGRQAQPDQREHQAPFPPGLRAPLVRLGLQASLEERALPERRVQTALLAQALQVRSVRRVQQVRLGQDLLVLRVLRALRAQQAQPVLLRQVRRALRALLAVRVRQEHLLQAALVRQVPPGP